MAPIWLLIQEEISPGIINRSFVSLENISRRSKNFAQSSLFSKYTYCRPSAHLLPERTLYKAQLYSQCLFIAVMVFEAAHQRQKYVLSLSENPNVLKNIAHYNMARAWPTSITDDSELKREEKVRREGLVCSVLETNWWRLFWGSWSELSFRFRE